MESILPDSFLHIPILAVSGILLVASFKGNTIYGCQGTDWLLIKGLVGMIGLFLFPWNASRLSTARAEESWIEEYHNKHLIKIPEKMTDEYRENIFKKKVGFNQTGKDIMTPSPEWKQWEKTRSSKLCIGKFRL